METGGEKSPSRGKKGVGEGKGLVRGRGGVATPKSLLGDLSQTQRRKKGPLRQKKKGVLREPEKNFNAHDRPQKKGAKRPGKRKT